MTPGRCSVSVLPEFVDGVVCNNRKDCRPRKIGKGEEMITRYKLSAFEEEKGDHTKLMRASLEGDTAKVKALLGGGAQVNAKDHEGRTALMFAVANMHADTAKQLLEHGADANATANDGGTPLILAASSGDTESVRALLNRGADSSARYTRTGETALMLAKKNNHDAVVNLLSNDRSHGVGKA
jgi:ankyrin repeat protein